MRLKWYSYMGCLPFYNVSWLRSHDTPVFPARTSTVATSATTMVACTLPKGVPRFRLHNIPWNHNFTWGLEILVVKNHNRKRKLWKTWKIRKIQKTWRRGEILVFHVSLFSCCFQGCGGSSCALIVNPPGHRALNLQGRIEPKEIRALRATNWPIQSDWTPKVRF